MSWRRIDVHRAAERGDVAVLERYLKAGGDPERKDSAYGAAPVHWSSLRGRVKATALLLDHGANIESRTGTDGTPLVWACMDGNPSVVKLLLDRGADVSSFTKGKGTALHHAATYGHAEVVGMLLRKGASAYAEDNRGDRPGDKFDHEVPDSVRCSLSKTLAEARGETYTAVRKRSSRRPGVSGRIRRDAPPAPSAGRSRPQQRGGGRRRIASGPFAARGTASDGGIGGSRHGPPSAADEDGVHLNGQVREPSSGKDAATCGTHAMGSSSTAIEKEEQQRREQQPQRKPPLVTSSSSPAAGERVAPAAQKWPQSEQPLGGSSRSGSGGGPGESAPTMTATPSTGERSATITGHVQASQQQPGPIWSIAALARRFLTGNNDSEDRHNDKDKDIQGDNGSASNTSASGGEFSSPQRPENVRRNNGGKVRNIDSLTLDAEEGCPTTSPESRSNAHERRGDSAAAPAVSGDREIDDLRWQVARLASETAVTTARGFDERNAVRDALEQAMVSADRSSRTERERSEKLTALCNALEARLLEKDAQVARLTQEIEDKNRRLREKDVEVSSLRARVKNLEHDTSQLRMHLNNLPGEEETSILKTQLATVQRRENQGSVDRRLGSQGRTKSSPSLYLRGDGGGFDMAYLPKGGPDPRSGPAMQTRPTADRASTNSHRGSLRTELVLVPSSRDVRFSGEDMMRGGSSSRETVVDEPRTVSDGSGLGLEHDGYPVGAAWSGQRSEMTVGTGGSRGRTAVRVDNAGRRRVNHVEGGRQDETGMGQADALEWWRGGNWQQDVLPGGVGKGSNGKSKLGPDPAEDGERLGSLYSMIARR